MTLLRFLIFALVSVAATAHAQTTARGALTILEHQAGQAETANVVAIVGNNGQNQPAAWKLLVLDRGNNSQLREYTVQNQHLTGPIAIQRDPKVDLPTTPILLTSLRVDSEEAFRIADDAAIAAGVGFDAVNYQLRWRGNDAEPTWQTTLVNSQGQVAGTVYIAASSGKVMLQQFSNAKNGQLASGAARPPQNLTPVSGRSMQQPVAEVSRVPAAPAVAPAPAPAAAQPRPQPQSRRQVQQRPTRPAPTSSNIWLLNPGKRQTQQAPVPDRYRPR